MRISFGSSATSSVAFHGAEPQFESMKTSQTTTIRAAAPDATYRRLFLLFDSIFRDC